MALSGGAEAHLQSPSERVGGTLERQCHRPPQGGTTRVQLLPLCSLWVRPSAAFCPAGDVSWTLWASVSSSVKQQD